MMISKPILAVIGGTGLYQMPDLEQVTEYDINTPFGKPSAPILEGTLEGQRVAFLARHGIGHHILPGEVNSQANIYALKSLGVERIVSINACGSLREDFTPGDFVIPDQVFDFTRNRQQTFFGAGMVAHVSVADPFCGDLSKIAYQAVQATGTRTHWGGTFITIEGPRFSTKAESDVFRTWGMSIIGMTACPEVFLAREAELCYCVIAHVTDYDVWHVSEKPVTVEMVMEILNQNTHTAQQAIRNLVRSLERDRSCECSHALHNAILTNPDRIPLKTRQKLGLLVDRYLP